MALEITSTSTYTLIMDDNDARDIHEALNKVITSSIALTSDTYNNLVNSGVIDILIALQMVIGKELNG